MLSKAKTVHQAFEQGRKLQIGYSARQEDGSLEYAISLHRAGGVERTARLRLGRMRNVHAAKADIMIG
jgi:hypothetical protein